MNSGPRTPRTSTKYKSNSLHIAREERNRDPMPTKRPVALMEEQVLLIKDTQNAIERILKDMEKYSVSEFDRREDGLQVLLNKSQELLVMLQVMMKIRNELAYARLDLEKAIKADRGIEIAKKRVKWLQQRLERLLSTTRSYCAVNLSAPTKFLEKSEVSEELLSLLSKEQQDRYFDRQDHRHGYSEDSVDVINDFAKMVLQPAPYNCLTKGSRSVTSSAVSEREEESENARDVEEEEKLPVLQQLQLMDSKKKRRKKKKTDSTRDGSPSLKVSVTLPEGDLYEGEGDSSPEPLSDSELDDDATESIVSSVGPLHDLKPSLSQDSAPQKSHLVDTAIQDQASSATRDTRDPDQEYWDMDHHQFEWSDYMLNLDSRSWHALGIAVQDSFISKEKHRFDSNLPWREKPLKVNSVIDVHKIALDKLLVRLHRMYEAIGQATQATIDPLPKDRKMETVMGKQEDIGTALDARPSTTHTVTAGTTSPGSRDVVLPPLPEVTPKSVTFIPLSAEPSMTKLGRKKADKLFPRQSKEWCEDIKSGYDMPRLVTSKPTTILKKTSNVQSRYLGRKPDTENVKKQYTLFRKDEWKPTAVMRLVGVMKAFDSRESSRERGVITVEKDTPRWRRLMELLGESGLKSSNHTISTEAAKTIGQLNCRHSDVIEALCQTISDPSKDARVCYEASKSLILLGTWSPQAIKVIIQHIKKGNELVVKELLYTMTKAKNIPFVDKTTPEFRSMVYLLIELIKVDYHPLSFRAAISLGRLCVVEPVSKSYLTSRLPLLSAEEKSEALLVLIKQMNCKDKNVLEMLLDHLCTAHNWKHRLAAAELLIFIGGRSLKILNAEKIFNVLERLLWDHSNKELRSKIAEAINILGFRQAACSQVLGRLEDPDEDVRARAVITLATLGMKGVKEMKALLDLLELDSSVYVRIQVVRAFSHLKWNDPRIIRALRERERGEGTLASEAKKSLSRLLEEEK